MNSFGFGGTNAHVILDDVESYLHHSQGISVRASASKGGKAFKKVMIAEANTPKLLLTSAADEDGCSRIAASVGASLKTMVDYDEETFLDDLTFTLNSRRTKFQWKRFAVCRTVDCIEKLGDSMSKSTRRDDTDANLAFVFAGQGAQWAGMIKQLLG